MNPPALIAGKRQLFQVPRGPDGRLRVGRWDRGMTPGEKIKDGIPTVFSVETFGQIIDNWKQRGEKIAYCYNHQSAYVEQNGQPAPALAYANAIAVVQDGKLVQFEKLLVSQATPPDVAELERQVAELATDEDPRPSPDGCWFYRCEHTELGEALLANFAFLSPMFVPDGLDEQGEEVGYVLFDLAATNTPFQSGCVISFERDGRVLTFERDGRLRTEVTMASLSSFREGDRVRVHAGGLTKDPHEGIVTSATTGDTVGVRLTSGPHKGEEMRFPSVQLTKLDGADPYPQQMSVTVSQLRVGDTIGSNEGTPVGTVCAIGVDRVLVTLPTGSDKWFDGRDLANMFKMEGATRRRIHMPKPGKLSAAFAAQFKIDGADKKAVRKLYSRKAREGAAAFHIAFARLEAKKLGKKFEESKLFDEEEDDAKRFEEEGPTVAAPDKGIGALAAKAEEMARQYEDAYEEEEDDEGDSPTLVMRKLAKKFRKLKRMEEMDGEAGVSGVGARDPAETFEEEEEEDEDARAKMARSLGLTGKPRLRDIARAYEAKTAPLSEVAELKNKLAVLEQDATATKLDATKKAATLFARQAVEDGRTTKEKQAIVETTYVEGGEKKAEELLFANGTFTALRRYVDEKGNPIGKPDRPVEYAQSSPDEISQKYAEKARQIMTEQKITFAQATARVRLQDPKLYEAYAATRRR